MNCPLCGRKMKQVEKKRYSIIFDCLRCAMEVTAKGFSETGNKIKIKEKDDEG